MNAIDELGIGLKLIFIIAIFLLAVVVLTFLIAGGLSETALKEVWMRQ